MSYCLNPVCSQPQNPDVTFCQSCGAKLLLRERYRAVRQIGQGGFGKTFLAVDQDLPNKPACVIKQFSPQIQGASGLQKATELFEQEAVQLNILGKHPQIPELLAHFEQDGRLYLVQEYVKGGNLAEELEKDGAFSEAKIRELLVGLLPVLQYIHDNQVIHRDIKPENIIRRNDGKLFLVDFGIVKLVTGSTLFKTGISVVGTLGYAAPEQLKGKTNFNSDLYSLGVTCLHLLSGIEPSDLFDDGEHRWIWRDYLLNPISQPLGTMLDKMVEIGINSRYQSASEILQVLSGKPKNRSVTNNQVKPVVKQENSVISEIISQSLIEPIEVKRKDGYPSGYFSYQDQSGQAITELLFDKALPFSEGLAIVKFKGKWGAIDQTGEFVIAPKLTCSSIWSFEDGLAKFFDGNYGLIDKSGKIIVEPRFSKIYEFCDGLAKVSTRGLCGLIDKSGKIIVEPRFKAIYEFCDDLAKVSIDSINRVELYGLINKYGKIIVEPQFNHIDQFYNGLAKVLIISGNQKKCGLINTDGELIVEPSYQEIGGFINGLAMVGNSSGFIDEKGNFISKELVNEKRQVIFNNRFVIFSEGLAAFESNKKWGFIDGCGKIIIKPKFLEVQPFSKGYTKVKYKKLWGDEKWRTINKQGYFVD